MLHKVLVTNIERAIGQHGSSHLASQAASRQCSISLWCVVEDVILFVWLSSIGFVIISLLCDIFPLKMKLMADQSQETREHMTAVFRNINIFIHRCRIMNRRELMCPLHQNVSATKPKCMFAHVRCWVEVGWCSVCWVCLSPSISSISLSCC